MKCFNCQRVTKTLNRKVPVGYKPFAWGNSDEDPCHFYIFPDDTPDIESEEPQKLDVIRLCEISNPVAR